MQYLAEELGKYATPTLFESSSEVSALPPSIVPLFRPIRIFGSAFPVAVDKGDNLAIHLAVANAPMGSVLVVSTGQDIDRGYWGEILMEAALHRGIKGLVIDGGVRDTLAMRERAFPVFAGSVAIPGTTKNRQGTLNQPVRIGQTLVRPGDFLVGDDDGVVVFPPQAAKSVLEAASARVRKEAVFLEKIKQGHLTVDLLSIGGTD